MMSWSSCSSSSIFSTHSALARLPENGERPSDAPQGEGPPMQERRKERPEVGSQTARNRYQTAGMAPRAAHSGRLVSCESPFRCCNVQARGRPPDREGSHDPPPERVSHERNFPHNSSTRQFRNMSSKLDSPVHTGTTSWVYMKTDPRKEGSGHREALPSWVSSTGPYTANG